MAQGDFMIPRVKLAIAPLLMFSTVNAFAQELKLDPDRIQMLEKKLAEARLQISELNRTVESLSVAVSELKNAPAVQAQEKHSDDFAARILVPDLGGDERAE